MAQKLSRLHFTLDEEELLTVLGVTQRLDDAAPRDKVTKKFYGEFEKQRKAFAAFIEGIPADSEDQRWYTAARHRQAHVPVVLAGKRVSG